MLIRRALIRPPYPNNWSEFDSYLGADVFCEGESSDDEESYKKRRPCTGSNFAKIPIVSEIPKIINPAAGVSSKTEKDPKPIKN